MVDWRKILALIGAVAAIHYVSEARVSQGSPKRQEPEQQQYPKPPRQYPIEPSPPRETPQPPKPGLKWCRVILDLAPACHPSRPGPCWSWAIAVEPSGSEDWAYTVDPPWLEREGPSDLGYQAIVVKHDAIGEKWIYIGCPWCDPCNIHCDARATVTLNAPEGAEIVWRYADYTENHEGGAIVHSSIHC